MYILHICNDFCYTKVHSQLYKRLDGLGVEQTVFSPIHRCKTDVIGHNEYESYHTQFVYAPVVKNYHRYVYHIKRSKVFHTMEKLIDGKHFDMVHATTLLTDGGLANLMWKKYSIPYVVSVRNTDINGFFDRMPHTWGDARRILIHAKKVFFISEGLKEKLENHRAVSNIVPQIKHKFVLLPNGIDDYYLDHVSRVPRSGHGIVYVGDFSSNKNVCRLVQAVLQLRRESYFSDLRLTIVGDGHGGNESVKRLIVDNPEVIDFLGEIRDEERLCEVLRQQSVFAMPSIHETFGLVYIEALSQNLAVVYTKGQGIDGLFDETVGIAVNPLSVDEISSAIRSIFNRRERYGNNHVDFTQFRWNLIAKKYFEHYRSILGYDNIKDELLCSFKKYGE